MSNPSLPPLPGVGFTLPADVTGNFAALLARMAQRGMAEIAEVLAPQANYTPMPGSGRLRATSRRHVPIAQLLVAVTVMGQMGQEALAQEGVRADTRLRLYWAPDARGVAYDPLTETNYSDRWVILPQRAPGKEWRIGSLVRLGAYYYALLEEGGVNDPAGGVK